MTYNSQKYDTINELRQRKIGEGEAMRLVPVGSLKRDSLLAKTIYNDNRHVLLKSGVKLTESLIEKLRSNMILSVYIVDDYSLGEIQDVISPELRNRAIREIKKVFESVQKGLKHQIKELENDKSALSKRLTLMTDQRYFDSISEVIEDMMVDLAKNYNAMVGLVDIKSMNNFLYQHAVQVTVLTLVIGADMKLNNVELKNLAIGAMLHDIGLSMIDSKLWLYKDDFSEEEHERYRSHPRKGYQFIKETSMLPNTATIGILEHHEMYNGEGYPLGRSGEGIHRNARVIAIADAYDRMTSGIEEGFVAPNEALEYIMGNSGDSGKFDIEMATRFVRRVVPFTIGTYVKLSNGLVAVVVDYNVNHPMRPILRVIEHDKPLESLTKLDLMDHRFLNLTILKSVY